MRKKIIKFLLPVSMGLSLLVITLMVLSSTIFVSSCSSDLFKTDHCKAGYPLWCSQAKVCCPAGYAYYCDGSCKSAPCTGGTVTVDSCVPE
ncbi:MAG: hypothetical protein M0R39_08835 [Prolixibacteraceae bacterium]|nr:hypothetical protein [Prolixibacteraceae bacterium]